MTQAEKRQQRWWTKRVKGILLIGLLFIVVFLGLPWLFVEFLVRSFPSLSSYGTVPIGLPDGRKVYLKRYSWSLSGDVLFLSSNPAPCVAPNPDADYLVGEGWQKIWYRMKEDGMEVFAHESRPPKEPTLGIPTKVKVARFGTPRSGDIRVPEDAIAVEVRELQNCD